MLDASMGVDQFRISYGGGLTPTEQLLKHLGERSFLRFWSHANPHMSPSQELCDLLVICGDYVIVFSDKSADFQFDRDEQTAWRRWYRRAVSKSIQQLNGAVRSLIELQVPIHKDRHCAVPLGIPMPPPERMRVHRAAVVSFSSDADFAMSQPFIEIDGSIIGDDHVNDGATPFRLGDVSPDSEFVHVIDIAGLQAVLSDLDTITGFARYLDARTLFIRGQAGNSAANEWCMLTRYLLSFTDDGTALPLDSSESGHTQLINAEWQSEEVRAAFKARKAANSESCLWDSLVDHHAEMLEQQSFEFTTYSGVDDAERVVRHMALETRLNRRLLSRMWKEACLIGSPGQAANVRTVPHSSEDGTTYVFLNLQHPTEMTEEQYRQRRRDLLKNMALAALVDVPTTEVVIGIASELGQAPDSHDLLHFNVAEDANPESILDDAKACWEFKRQMFGAPVYSTLDERDMPPIG